MWLMQLFVIIRDFFFQADTCTMTKLFSNHQYQETETTIHFGMKKIGINPR